MAELLNIRLRICNKDYDLKIPSEKEEVYRLAARQVNDSVAALGRAGFEDYNAKDYLALAALDFAQENIRMSQSREVGNEDVRELNAISERISEYMNRLGE